MTPPLFAAGAACVLLYLSSAYPTLSSYRDAGDMAAGAWTLGVPHPPGTPLYIMIAHLWDKAIPGLATAFKLNIMSALFSARS